MLDKDELFEVTSNMNLKYGGTEGGWMQVIDVDMRAAQEYIYGITSGR